MAEKPEVPLSPYRTVGTKGRKIIGDIGNNVYEDPDVPTTPLTAVDELYQKGRYRWQLDENFVPEEDPAKQLENLSKQMAARYGVGTPAYESAMRSTIAQDRTMGGGMGSGELAKYVAGQLTPDKAKQLGLNSLLPGPADQAGTTSASGLNISGLFGGGSGASGGGAGDANDPRNAERKSAYDLLYAQFKQYGLESLVEPLRGLITSATPPSEFVIKLRETDAYKKRFAGNAARIAKGLAAISEAEYIGLEDQYQNIMRNYGLPASYWAKDSMGTQKGFTNLIGNDVDALELEDRIMNAQKRVINANPEVSKALKQFYPEITNGDILAYVLDPTNGKDVIKNKITAAEIGGAALAQGLETGMTRAEELAKYGVNKAEAMQGYGTIAGGLQRGSQLASIYGQDPYTQTTAEKEVFGLAGKAEAEKQRKKLTGLETASFRGQTGLTGGALARDRAGGY
jgi:hypothetical protein